MHINVTTSPRLHVATSNEALMRVHNVSTSNEVR